jgi:hypothetical protein
MTDSIKNQAITFNNPPPLIIGFVKNMWQIKWKSGFTPTADQRMEAMEDPLNYGDPIYPYEPFNFGYSSSNLAYKAGLDGKMLGDKNYFGHATAIESIDLPESLQVKTWISPETRTMNIVFETPAIASFKLRMYGLDGRQYINKQLYNYGQTHQQVQLKNLSKGLYIYEVESTSLNGEINHARGKVIM